MKKERLSIEQDPHFEQVVTKIEELISHSLVEKDPDHSKLTFKNVLALNPEADKALQIAALAHDIDRADEKRTVRIDYKDYNEYKRNHSLRSAAITSDILREAGYDDEFIKRVKTLIERHEVGGEGDAETLMAADSISFFQENLPFYIKGHTLEQTRDKIRFMYDRLSDKAKEEVRKIEFPDEIRDLFFETISKS